MSDSDQAGRQGGLQARVSGLSHQSFQYPDASRCTRCTHYWCTRQNLVFWPGISSNRPSQRRSTISIRPGEQQDAPCLNCRNTRDQASGTWTAKPRDEMSEMRPCTAPQGTARQCSDHDHGPYQALIGSPVPEPHTHIDPSCRISMSISTDVLALPRAKEGDGPRRSRGLPPELKTTSTDWIKSKYFDHVCYQTISQSPSGSRARYRQVSTSPWPWLFLYPV